MAETPLVSILCLSMNHEAYVQRSFESIIKQTYRNIEILYVDNNSRDKTFEVADKILKDSGFKYQGSKRDKNFSITQNLNYLVKRANGKYFTILSADDFWEPDNLEEKIKYLEENPQYGMIYGGGYKYYYDTGEKRAILENDCKSGWVFKDILKDNFINAIGAVIKKSVLEEVGSFDENSLIEDWDLWIRIAEKYQIGYLNKKLIYYGQRTGSNISRDNKYMDKGWEYILNKYSGYKEIKAAKKNLKLYRISEYATTRPSLKTLSFILKNFQFNFVYFKQLIKCIIGIMGYKSKKEFF